MFYQRNNTLPTWYSNYGKLLTEQVAVFSEDANERLKQYLDSNENLLEKIELVYNSVNDGEIKEEYIDLDSDTYQVQPGDGINLRIDKTDPSTPQIIASIENDDMLVGDLNLGKAAGLVYKSMDGMGTDELLYASTIAAIHMSLAERGVSDRGVQRVFDMFNNTAFATKYEGYTLDEWIDGDFDGRDEACAMALARRPIPKSFIRGISWGTVFTDVGMLLLAIPTLGASLAGTSVGRAAISGGKAVAKVAKTVKNSKRVANATAKAKAIAKATRAGKLMAKVTPTMIKSWKGMSSAARLAKVKAFMPVGKEVSWLAKSSGKTSKCKVLSYFTRDGKQFVQMKQLVKADGKKSGIVFTTGIGELVQNAGKAGGMSMKSFSKFAPAAGLMLPLNKLETGNLEGIVGEDEEMDDMFNPYNPAELLGYYDQTTADPDKAMNQYKSVAAADLAVQLHDAMDGWTDNSDELAIALMILSMDKVSANAVKKEYETAYGTKFYDEVVASELEATMEELVGCYWAALTGDGPYVSQVKQKLAQIK